MQVLDWNGVEHVPPLSTFPTYDHKIGLFKHLQVLHHRTTIEFGKRLAQLPGRLRTVLQAVKESSSDAIAEGAENLIFIIFG